MTKETEILCPFVIAIPDGLAAMSNFKDHGISSVIDIYHFDSKREQFQQRPDGKIANVCGTEVKLTNLSWHTGI